MVPWLSMFKNVIHRCSKLFFIGVLKAGLCSAMCIVPKTKEVFIAQYGLLYALTVLMNLPCTASLTTLTVCLIRAIVLKYLNLLQGRVSKITRGAAAPATPLSPSQAAKLAMHMLSHDTCNGLL